MKRAPVAKITMRPADLPVFDDSWKERCTSCKHLAASSGAGGNRVLRCKHPAVPPAARAVPAHCIDARDVGSACGPDAQLWEEMV